MSKAKRPMVMVPVSLDQLATIKAAAESEGMPVATWVRVLALKRARAVLAAASKAKSQ